jgi:hypothetical protein
VICKRVRIEERDAGVRRCQNAFWRQRLADLARGPAHESTSCGKPGQNQPRHSDSQAACANFRIEKNVRFAASLLFNGCDFDRGDKGFESVEVCVAFGQNANHGEFVFAEPFGQGFEPPAQNHYVGSGEGKREFLWRRIPVVGGVRVWFDGVVNQLAGVEAVTMFLVELELDTGAILVHCFITMFPRNFFRG